MTPHRGAGLPKQPSARNAQHATRPRVTHAWAAAELERGFPHKNLAKEDEAHLRHLEPPHLQQKRCKASEPHPKPAISFPISDIQFCDPTSKEGGFSFFTWGCFSEYLNTCRKDRHRYVPIPQTTRLRFNYSPSGQQGPYSWLCKPSKSRPWVPYLSSQIIHVGSKLTEKVIALMEEGQVGIHEGQHLAGRTDAEWPESLQEHTHPTPTHNPQGLSSSDTFYQAGRDFSPAPQP